jgi:hypothetical protein
MELSELTKRFAFASRSFENDTRFTFTGDLSACKRGKGTVLHTWDFLNLNNILIT